VGDDPVNKTDPTGLAGECPTGGNCAPKPENKIQGKAQESSKTPTHGSTSQRIANEAAQDPNTKSVHLNQSLRTVTGDNTAPNQRPDVTVVNEDGSIDQHEVVSKGQTVESQQAKLDGLRAKLGVPGNDFVHSPDPVATTEKATVTEVIVEGASRIGLGTTAAGVSLLLFSNGAQ
jgi:hypothetical protein